MTCWNEGFSASRWLSVCLGVFAPDLDRENDKRLELRGAANEPQPHHAAAAMLL
jgi:hypothetical protein